MSVKDQRRQAFEAHIQALKGEDFVAEYDLARRGDGYARIRSNDLWVCWNAALDGATISLPDRYDQKYQEHFDDVEGGSFNAPLYIRDVREAIEAAGLKVKP